MKAVFLGKSTVVVNHEEISSIDVLVEGQKFRVWQSFDNKEWSFLPPYGFVERNPAVCAMTLTGSFPMPYERWEEIKNVIRPLLTQVEALVEDQQVWQNIQTLDPFSRC